MFDEPVGYVDVGFAFFCGGVLVEYGADGDVESCVAELLEPGVEAVDVREGDDFASFEDGEAVRGELGFASCGEPEVVGHYAGADDGGLFGFDESYGFVGCRGEQVFSEEALCEFPVLWQSAVLFHQGVYPGDASFGVLVFDAVSGDGVVFHYFACSAAAFCVGLEEDYGLGFGDAYAVLQDEAAHCFGVEYGEQECGELGVITGLY